MFPSVVLIYRVAVSIALLLLLRFALHESWLLAAVVAILFLIAQLAFWWAQHRRGPADK